MNQEPKFNVGKNVKFKGEKHKIISIDEENGEYRYFFDEYEVFGREGYIPIVEMQLSALESELIHAR